MAWSYTPAACQSLGRDLVRFEAADVDAEAPITLADEEIDAALVARGLPNRELSDSERRIAFDVAADMCEVLAARWEQRPDANLLSGQGAVRPLTRAGGLRLRARQLRERAQSGGGVRPARRTPAPVFGRRFSDEGC